MPEEYNSLSEVLAAYWPTAAISLAISAVATPLLRRFALARGIVDRPDDYLKPHKQPIPYLGGVAIFLGWAAGIAFAMVRWGEEAPFRAQSEGPSIPFLSTFGILLAGLGITGLGLFDDLRLTSPKTKLVVGALVALVVVVFGIGDDILLLVLRSTGIKPADLPGWVVLAYSAPLAVFVVVGACNATNLIDGMDGLCSGVLGIMAAGFLVLAVHLHLWNRWHPLDVQRVTLSLAMMGAALGFLPYNRNPAKIFMGDAGSMLLGLNAAVLLLLFAESGAIRWMLAALMIFALPLGDMLLTIARRWRGQRPLMQGDRSHYYDQLVDRGWPIPRVVGLSYLLAAFFVVLGCAPIVLRLRYIIPLYLLVALAILVIVKKLRMVRVDSPRPSKELRR